MNEFESEYVRHMAPGTRRQMPIFAQVGKGMPGDSFTIECAVSNGTVFLEGRAINSMTNENELIWSKPMNEVIPQLHYSKFSAVREIDGILWNGFYIVFSYKIGHEDSPTTLWETSLPFFPTTKFFGQTIPEDTIIEYR